MAARFVNSLLTSLLYRGPLTSYGETGMNVKAPKEGKFAIEETPHVGDDQLTQWFPEVDKVEPGQGFFVEFEEPRDKPTPAIGKAVSKWAGDRKGKFVTKGVKDGDNKYTGYRVMRLRD